MKKLLALLLALVMVLALAACGGGSAPAEAPAEEPAAEEPAAPAAPEEPEAPAEEPAEEAGDDFAEYKVYFGEYAAAGAPNDEERENMKNLIEGCEAFEDIEALPQSTVLFDTVGVLRFDEWLAAGKPAADTEGMVSEAAKQGASGEPSGEPSDEPAEAAGDASGEPSGDASAPPPSGDGAVFPIPEDLPAGLPVEEAYVEYVRAFLAAELEVNTNMTAEQVEGEFMPAVEAGNYDGFPVDMLYNGMLSSGVALTFDEFAAQY